MGISLLPDEIKAAFEEQRIMFQEMQKSFQETNAMLKASLEQRDILIKNLREQIAALQKVIYGSRSEKTIYIDSHQKSLFPNGSEDNTQPGTQCQRDTTGILEMD